MWYDQIEEALAYCNALRRTYAPDYARIMPGRDAAGWM